jgi:hypothetical protein
LDIGVHFRFEKLAKKNQLSLKIYKNVIIIITRIGVHLKMKNYFRGETIGSAKISDGTVD